jgi:Lrp/AsnC family leucine-responsive transcriptional regulator
MDQIDHQILTILQKKARVPNVEVARTIGMAPSAILERIKKLEAKGIIQGYEVRLNPNQFNCNMIAFIQIKLDNPANIQKTGRKIAKIDQIQEVHYIAGEDALLIKLRVADNTELETLLRTKISVFEAVIDTRTLIVLSTYKETAKIQLTSIPDAL